MPDTISFSTFLAVVITEFCVMCFVLMIFLERSVRRAFRHLGEMIEKNEEIESLQEFVRDCRDNWDCDEDAHRYNTPCRSCEAKKLLGMNALKLATIRPEEEDDDQSNKHS